MPSSKCIFGVIPCANAGAVKSALTSTDSANIPERSRLALNIVFFIIRKTILTFYINIISKMEKKLLAV
jgi:hypothetical protein